MKNFDINKIKFLKKYYFITDKIFTKSIKLLLIIFVLSFIYSNCIKDALVIDELISQEKLPFITDTSADTISQYGITWRFSKPVAYGKFVNGDYWIVGPVSVTSITPAPANGRNGSTINVNVSGTDYTTGKACWDSRIVSGRYDSSNLISLPLNFQPGNSLISTISIEQLGVLTKMLYGGTTNVPTRTAAVLTCLDSPPPQGAFRPGYADPEQTIYLSSQLQRQLLPNFAHPNNVPSFSEYERYLERPWLDTAYDEFTAPTENMPVYGREYTRIISMAALLLCLDYTPAEKETLLIRLVQIGIDLRGLIKAGYLGWPAVGGHGNGRKLPLILAGKLLGEEDMQRPDLYFPNAKFSEDIQTMYDNCWTGAIAVYAGHAGAAGHPNYTDWGAYEHLPPSQWPGTIGESYRRCCTSIAWVGEATAAKLLDLQLIWNHNAFFDYVERWMTEDDTVFAQTATQVTGVDFTQSWAAQRQAWDRFVENMWNLYWF